MPRRTFLTFALVCFATAVAHAGATLDRNISGEGVTVSLTSPYSDLPPGGCVPYQVKVDNDRGSEGTWRIFFSGSNNSGTSGTAYYEEKVTVPAHTSSVFNFMVPLPFTDERGNCYLNIGASGPGLPTGPSFSGYVYSNTSGSTVPPFCAFSETALGKSGTGPLESYYKDHGQAFYGTSIEKTKLPDDWRGYAGLARLFLTDGDWLDLAATQRQAILDWIAQGGRLSILTTDVSDARVAALQLPSANGKAGPYGFGNISLDQLNSLPPDAEFLAAASHRDPARTAQGVDADFSTWGLRDGIGTIVLHGGFILCFVFAFGVLVGPVNLFVFARGKNRFRLFWTTPLIAIGASLALIIGILFTDGLGGHGRRLTAILSMPESNREVVMQEQIARTAVLFSSRWHGDDGGMVSPISDTVLDGSVRTRNAYYRSRRNDASGDFYNKNGNDYSGHWFRSRAMVGQYLQEVRPSRSSIMVVNAADLGGSSGQGPIILSSYPQILSQVYLIDHNGTYWQAEDVKPGVKTRLTESNVGAFSSFWATSYREGGGKLRPLLQSARDRNGYFYAKADAVPGQVLPTVNEIHWQDETTVILGPWVSASNTEKSP